MRTKMLLTMPLMVLFVAGVAFGFVPGEEKEAGKEAPKIPGITKVEPGTKIKDIKSDPFTMKGVTIEGGVMEIKVSYGGGNEEHEFTLYWSGITTRSYPPQTNVFLKHDANGDMAEALLTKTLQFDLADMNKPMVITVRTDHGDQAKVTYGKP